MREFQSSSGFFLRWCLIKLSPGFNNTFQIRPNSVKGVNYIL